MGRPRIHKTEEARLAAARESCRRYYARHTERINAKRSVGHEPESTTTIYGDDSGDSVLTLSSCLAMVKEAKDELVAYAPTPQPFIEEILGKYIESMPNDPDDEFGLKSTTGNLAIIEKAVATVEEIYRKAQKGQVTIYETCGVCPEWRATDQVCRGIQELLVMLEDILCLAMMGASALAEAHFLGKLAYLKHE